MKPSVLITLIICGTVLLLTPSIADFIHAQQSAALFARRTDLSTLSFNDGQMPDLARIGFWLTGTLALASAILGGFVAFWRDRASR